MREKISKNLIKQLLKAFIYEEKTLVAFQYNCYRQLPGDFEKEELERAKKILDIIIVQSLNHANILSELIINFYAQKTAKKF